MYGFLTFMLTNFLVRTLQYFWNNFAQENIKKLLYKVAYFKAQVEIFSTANRPQNQHKSYILFHENDSLWDLWLTDQGGQKDVQVPWYW